jgi:hypothetical protein
MSRFTGYNGGVFRLFDFLLSLGRDLEGVKIPTEPVN